jgi:WhiB family redox-sensing transcriptional regulator
VRIRDQVFIDREPPGEWAAQAACLGMDPTLFFPTRGDMDTLRAARAVCRACPVRVDCLEWALSNREFQGVFGGTSERERRRIVRARRRAA